MAKEENKTAMTSATTGHHAMTQWDERSLENEGFTQEVIYKFNDAGEKCRGVFVGAGADILMTEPDENGDPVYLKTWRVQNRGTTVRIIGTHELDSWFAGLAVGTEVAIVFKGEEQLAGGRRRVKRYAMYAKRDEKKIAAAAANSAPQAPGAVVSKPQATA